MRDVAEELLDWWQSGERVGIGTVVATFRSAPRPAGAVMLVGPDGTAVGSVSGGCVEGAVYELATAARPVFATTKRFPDADKVVVEWPHKYLARTAVDDRTVICVLTHDPKFDGPLLEVALRLPAAYVGAMGSRTTHEKRLAQLREAGLSDEELARLSSPIGLDLGARTPEETAISIAAEIVAAHWGGSGRRLSQLTQRIHHEPEPEPDLVAGQYT